MPQNTAGIKIKPLPQLLDHFGFIPNKKLYWVYVATYNLTGFPL